MFLNNNKENFNLTSLESQLMKILKKKKTQKL